MALYSTTIIGKDQALMSEAGEVITQGQGNHTNYSNVSWITMMGNV